ncbi:helix-turn-helix transcriptional regulator [Bacillus toyonensis]
MVAIRKVNLKKIKDLRKEQQITLEEMSKILGYDSPNGYHYIEKGRSKFSAEALGAGCRCFKGKNRLSFLKNKSPKWRIQYFSNKKNRGYK